MRLQRPDGGKWRIRDGMKVQRISLSSSSGDETSKIEKSRTIQEQNRQRALKYLQEHTKDPPETEALFIADDERRALEQQSAIGKQATEDYAKSKSGAAREEARRRLQKYGEGRDGELPSVEMLCKMLEVEHGAVDVTAMDVREKASFTDWLVIASGLSERHVVAIGDGISRDLRAARSGLNLNMGASTNDITVSGRESGQWIVVDGGHVIIHVMTEDCRQVYALEELWTNDGRANSLTPDDVDLQEKRD